MAMFLLLAYANGAYLKKTVENSDKGEKVWVESEETFECILPLIKTAEGFMFFDGSKQEYSITVMRP